MVAGPTFWSLSWTGLRSRAGVSGWPLFTSLGWKSGRAQGPLFLAGPLPPYLLQEKPGTRHPILSPAVDPQAKPPIL